MALPASGQIAFSDVRTEMSQSSLNNYEFSKWAAGHAYWGDPYGGGRAVYSPINYLSSGSRWSLSSNVTMSRSNLSMSAWYGYDHTLFVATNNTGTFQAHFSAANANTNTTGSPSPTTMIILDAGTSNATFSINISGSQPFTDWGDPLVQVWYGKPWSHNGVGTGSATFITSSLGSAGVINKSFTYNYTYDSNKGQYIYVVLYPAYT